MGPSKSSCDVSFSLFPFSFFLQNILFLLFPKLTSSSVLPASPRPIRKSAIEDERCSTSDVCIASTLGM